MDLASELKKISSEVFDDEKTLNTYSTDASIFRVKPKAVVFPENSKEIGNIVKFVSENKKNNPSLSVSVRAGGSCMSGGSLNESIILDVTKHLNSVGGIKYNSVEVEPGTFYRDFEPKTLEKSLILPCFTGSKNLCALGGMIGNNCAGEKTLKYGKMENYVKKLSMIFSDGVERELKSLNKDELGRKKNQKDFEGEVYRKLDDLLTRNKDLIERARPKVSKNSAGYYLWNIKHNGLFDLNKLIVGSQGTLGIVSKAEVSLVPIDTHSKLLIVFMRNIDHLGEIVNEILEHNPETLESYDDSTLKFALKFMPELFKGLKAKDLFKLIFSFLPEALMTLQGGLPKFILLAGFSGKDEKEVEDAARRAKESIKHFHLTSRISHSAFEIEKYMTIRRESFNLLRKHVQGRRTAPFIDDVIVRPEFLPEVLPKLREILDRNNLLYTIAGHAGNGNFHIIPLMDFHDVHNRELILSVSKEVYALIHKFDGSITAEHNDGIIRTPYLEQMYGREVVELFRQVKEIFDPQNIFNPGKKVGGSFEYLENHIALE